MKKLGKKKNKAGMIYDFLWFSIGDADKKDQITGNRLYVIQKILPGCHRQRNDL
jgi:hypothetical protein